jgi:protocatechuate 3,4-dioxygenase, alpha subunit
VTRGTTPSQTVGPFFAVGLPWSDGPHVVDEGAAGAIRIGGRVLDGEGKPVPDALVETWQPDPEGRFDHPDDPRGRFPGFRGFGRCPTDDDGRWEIVTRKPTAAAGEAPHLAVAVFARGLLDRVPTRLYFADEQAANAADPLLSSLDPERRATLLATPDGAGAYRFDVHLQGDYETVFFSF